MPRCTPWAAAGYKRAFPALSDQPETDVMLNHEPDNVTRHLRENQRIFLIIFPGVRQYQRS
jgi:hypothetical protein